MTEIRTATPNHFSAQIFFFSLNGTLPAKNTEIQWKRDSVQWLEDYISEIGGPKGHGDRMGHVFFSSCLEGAALDWYCTILEYKPKIYWNLLPATFSSHWNPITQKIHAQDTLPSSSPTSTDDMITASQALPPQTLPTVESTTNQA